MQDATTPEPVVERPPARVRFVRWFCLRSPWHRWKPRLVRWAARRLDRSRGPAVYDGILGRYAVELDLGDGYGRDVYFNAYEVLLRELLGQVLQPGDTFVDGGANIGYTTLIASGRVGDRGRVYAFEPMPEALAALRRNLERNEIGNVTVVPKGCWDEAGSAEIFRFEGQGTTGASLGRRADVGVAASFGIGTVPVQDVVEGPVRAIKLDVEGAELPALRGCGRLFDGASRPHVIAELKVVTAESFGYHPLDIVTWLGERGPWRLHLLERRRRRPIDRPRLSRILERWPHKTHDVWFEPVG